MADTRLSRLQPRGLWWEALKKPKFRSHREKVCYYTYTFGVGLPIVILAALLTPVASDFYRVGVALGVFALQYVGWLVWLAWGRERFPLAPPDGSVNL